jgi:hypothetical protein
MAVCSGGRSSRAVLERQGHATQNWDQITLAEAWIESGIRCAKIPLEIYADDSLRDDSAIWHANVGDRKPRYYERFREEFRRQCSELTLAETSFQ